jgi:hypothetical protein
MLARGTKSVVVLASLRLAPARAVAAAVRPRYFSDNVKQETNQAATAASAETAAPAVDRMKMFEDLLGAYPEDLKIQHASHRQMMRAVEEVKKQLEEGKVGT